MPTSKKLSVKSKLNDIITFNVGGQIYSTKRSTILENVDSKTFLSLLIKNKTTNEYFLDRDGKYFSYILNYLRDKKLNLPKNFQELKQLLSEAKFYQIDRLIDEIENCLNQSNEKNKHVEKNHFYLTLISNTNEQKRIVKMIGPLKLILVLNIKIIGKKFLNIISTHYDLEQIHCQFIFPYNEQHISCQPLNQLERLVFAIQAKKMGLVVSYYEDYIYIPMESNMTSKDEFSRLLVNKYQGKILNTNITHDESTNLVENWLLSKQSDEIYSNTSIISV